MREVAALAGVSIKTVSRVVNGEAGVSHDLTRRVEQAATQLDYHPNLAASNLRRSERRTGTVGLMLEDVANPFSATIHRAIWDAATERHMAVLASSLDEDPVRERDMARAMILRRVDGLVIVPSGDDQSYLRTHIDAGMSIVFVDRPPSFLDADSVVAANRSGAREATEHLIAHGHRRIAFLADLDQIATAVERRKGYMDAMRSAGLPVDDRLVQGDLHTREMAQAAAEEMLRLPADTAPTAFFASQNLVTIGTIHTLHRHDLQHLVALVGFDEVELADLLEPGVTVVANHPYRMGQEAAEVLFARIDGYRGPSEHRVVPTRLIVRGSGEIGPREAVPTN
jgi:LacI family transcriptional regulator